MEDRTSNVYAAFEMLLEEVETEIDLVSRNGARAFEVHDLERARAALDRAERITTFRDKAAALRKEWEALAPPPSEEDEVARAERADHGRLRNGLRTPEQEYFLPILRSLESMGGSGAVNDVLERVYRLMRETLTEVDHQPLGSDANIPRWRNAAQWARYTLVRNGLLKPDSPRGLWELTEQGRKAL